MKEDCSKFAACLYFTSAALARKMEKLATDSWKPVGLSPSHAYLLLAVLDEPGIQPTALASVMELQPSTITRFMDKLESKKLIIRTTEGKTTNVYPTPKAKELAPKMKTCLQQFSAAYATMLGKEESMALTKTMSAASSKISV